jgi:mannose-6-phosphate isomerase-like protein (cupin superfamily)
MSTIEIFLKSGIVSAYVLGTATEEEAELVKQMSAMHPEVRQEIASCEETLEAYAMEHAVEPPLTVKPFLRAIIDYTERMTNGELPADPPHLNALSKIEDYSEWLEHKDFKLPSDFDGVYAKIFGYTPKAITAVVWLKEAAPYEVHDDEFEKFLVLEGTCEITIGDEVHAMKAGDYLAIPLFKNHMVKVTSEIPCKVILQRIAA